MGKWELNDKMQTKPKELKLLVVSHQKEKLILKCQNQVEKTLAMKAWDQKTVVFLNFVSNKYVCLSFDTKIRC